MPNSGDLFRDSIIDEILSWEIDGLEIYKEPYVGSRFVGQKRNVDIVLRYIPNGKSVGIEAKTQQVSGTTYQKIPYALDDAEISPIPMIIVFSGDEIKPDIKTKLINSGRGLEVKWKEEDGLSGDIDVLKQRIFIELGLDWLVDQSDKKVSN